MWSIKKFPYVGRPFLFCMSISKLEWSFATNSFRRGGFCKRVIFLTINLFIDSHNVVHNPRFPKSIGWPPLSQNLATSRTIFTRTFTNLPCHIKSYDGRQNRSARGSNGFTSRSRDVLICHIVRWLDEKGVGSLFLMAVKHWHILGITNTYMMFIQNTHR